MKPFRITRRVATGVGLLSWSIVVWWALAASLPHNPTSPGLAAERGTRLVLPEGWGFFTRNPREADLLIARPDDEGEWRVEPPHASLSNLVGLSRSSRALPVESSLLLQGFDAPFQECDTNEPWQICANRVAIHTIDNAQPRPLLCGDVAFLRREPVPWAWAGLLEPEGMPTKVLRTRIRCHHGTQS